MKSKYVPRYGCFFARAMAASETAVTVMPGGRAMHFCTLARQTSRFHLSNCTGMPPREETESTSTSASGASSRTTAASAATSFVTPVEVSLWVIVTAS
jgi:hypothetical protein